MANTKLEIAFNVVELALKEWSRIERAHSNSKQTETRVSNVEMCFKMIKDNVKEKL